MLNLKKHLSLRALFTSLSHGTTLLGRPSGAANLFQQPKLPEFQKILFTTNTILALPPLNFVVLIVFWSNKFLLHLRKVVLLNL